MKRPLAEAAAPQEEPAAQDDAAADAGGKRQEDHVRPLTSAEAELAPGGGLPVVDGPRGAAQAPGQPLLEGEPVGDGQDAGIERGPAPLGHKARDGRRRPGVASRPGGGEARPGLDPALGPGGGVRIGPRLGQHLGPLHEGREDLGPADVEDEGRVRHPRPPRRGRTSP
jgi:hypothetical protein